MQPDAKSSGKLTDSQLGRFVVLMRSFDVREEFCSQIEEKPRFQHVGVSSFV